MATDITLLPFSVALSLGDIMADDLFAYDSTDRPRTDSALHKWTFHQFCPCLWIASYGRILPFLVLSRASRLGEADQLTEPLKHAFVRDPLVLIPLDRFQSLDGLFQC